MTFTVGSLLALRAIGTSSLTPGVGEDRPVSWAHVCELADPWRWLGPDTLVMTTGIAVPGGDAEQCAYLDGMYAAGIAAIAVDATMMRAPFNAAALAHATQIGFPVLETAHDVRFSMVARVVASAALGLPAADSKQFEQLHGALLLSELCDGTVPSTAAARLLSGFGVGAPFICAVAQPKDPRAALAEAQSLFAAAETAMLAIVREGRLLLLVESGPEPRAVLEALAERNGGIGASARFHLIDELPVAVQQARRALIRNHEAGRLLAYAEHDATSLFLPSDPDQLRRIARQVLGPLRTYDEQRGTALTQTLRTFLEENRSWVRASERLYVHRQTLIARISRIEKIIDRNLSSMEDAAECWLAIQAAIGCGDLEPSDDSISEPSADLT